MSISKLVPAAVLGIFVLSFIPLAAAQQTPQPDPQMSVVLNELKAITGTPLIDLKPVDARQQFGAQDAAKIIARETGKANSAEPVGHVMDTMIPGPGGSLPVRIYSPAGKGPFPVIVYFHGGGFVIATIDTYDASARALTNLVGAVVVTVEYRKAPQFPFPAAVNDAIATYKWAVRNSAAINGIPGKIAVAGESAGGNLATVVAMAARDRHLTMPLHQTLVYPVVNNDLNTPSAIEFTNTIPLNTPALVYFYKYYYSNPADNENPYAFPLKGNLSGLPSATIIAAQIDPLQSEGQQYANALKAAGVAVNYQLYTGVTHEFFGMASVLDKAKEADAVAAADLKAAFAK